jgi:hypothetical protein
VKLKNKSNPINIYEVLDWQTPGIKILKIRYEGNYGKCWIV